MTTDKRKQAKSAGWIFDYSKPLNMEYAYRKIYINGNPSINGKKVEVITADGVKYSPEEIKIIAEFCGTITLDIHNVKKIFKGKITKGLLEAKINKNNQKNLDF